MGLSPRSLIGFGAGFASMAFVLLAAFSAPQVEATSHASSCPGSRNALPPVEAEAEAERPA
ncbi:MAG: hypothetical protein R3C46_07680 [Hyphomonadaceae bacterium]